MATTLAALRKEILLRDLRPPAEPPKGQLTILRAEYLNLIKTLEETAEPLNKQVQYCAAKLINWLWHWTDWKIQHYHTGWVYHRLKDIHAELQGEHSLHVIRAALEFLIKTGLLLRRQNLRGENYRNGQDKVYQYRLRQDLIENLIKQGQPDTIPELSTVELESSAFNAESHTQIHSSDSSLVSSLNKNEVNEWEEEKEDTAAGDTMLVVQKQEPPGLNKVKLDPKHLHIHNVRPWQPKPEDYLYNLKPPSFEELVRIQQAKWRTGVKSIQALVLEWINKTSGVVLGVDGPELVHLLD